MTFSISRKAAVAGAAMYQYKRGASPMSQRHVLLRAIVAAAEDAGLNPSDIDGFVSYGDDGNEPIKLTHELGTKDMRWSSAVWGGGGGGTCAAIEQATVAIATGQARVVVVFRALVEGNSGRVSEAVAANHFNLHFLMAGLTTPVQYCALRTRRLIEAKGVDPAAIEALVRADYYHASRNPEAVAFGNQFTSEDYHSSRWIAEPYHLFDCSRENDGAGAIIVVSAEHARDLKQKPIYVAGAAHGAEGWGHELQLNDKDFESAGFENVAPRAFQQAGLTPADIDAVQVYENFSGQAVAALIGHGFCDYENASEVLTFENLIAPSGKLPVNTHGGNLGHGFIHGVGTFIEGVRQLRGTSANPVPGARNCLVISGSPAPVVSSVIFSNES